MSIENLAGSFSKLYLTSSALTEVQSIDLFFEFENSKTQQFRIPSESFEYLTSQNFTAPLQAELSGEAGQAFELEIRVIYTDNSIKSVVVKGDLPQPVGAKCTTNCSNIGSDVINPFSQRIFSS